MAETKCGSIVKPLQYCPGDWYNEGELGRYQQIEWFIQGMPEEMAEITVLLAKLDPYNPESLNFDITYEVALSQI